MRIRIVLGLFAVLLIVPSAVGYDSLSARQSAGIYVSVDRRTSSLFLDFPATLVDGEPPLEIAVSLNTDLKTWIDDQEIPAGRHSWAFQVESADVWTIGRRAARRRVKTRRFAFEVKKVGTARDCLAAWFTPAASSDSVLLTVAVGDREGTLVLRLKEKTLGADGERPVDAMTLSAVRDDILSAAAEIESVRRGRHLWSGLLMDMGDEMLKAEGKGWIEEFDLIKEEDFVSLIIRGQLPGERDAVKELCGRLRAGELSKAFQTVLAPDFGMKKDNLRGFKIAAQTVAADWSAAEGIASTSGKRDVDRIAEEISLLEARILYYAPATVTDIKAAQALLLEAKRESGALIGRITPSAPTGKRGLRQFEVGLKLDGCGPDLIGFLRTLEDRPEPLRIVPLTLRETQFGPELTLSIVFYTYRPLAARDSRLARAVTERTDNPDAKAKRDAAIKQLPATGGRPFSAPEWKRDPYAKPRKEE